MSGKSPTSVTLSVDKTQCPLCNKVNNCAMEKDKTSSSCWCQNTRIKPELIAKANQHGKNKSCICQSCAEQALHLGKEIK